MAQLGVVRSVAGDAPYAHIAPLLLGAVAPLVGAPIVPHLAVAVAVAVARLPVLLEEPVPLAEVLAKVIWVEDCWVSLGVDVSLVNNLVLQPVPLAEVVLKVAPEVVPEVVLKVAPEVVLRVVPP